MKTVIIVSTEKDAEGKYVFHGDDGKPFMWGPQPERYEYHRVQIVAEADQVSFLCPLCFAKNGGAVGTHRVMVSLAGRNIPDAAGSRDHTGKLSRWNVSGTTIDDLVLTPSILLHGPGCGWHGFVGSNGIPPGHAG